MLRNEYTIFFLHFYFWDFAYIFTFWFITNTSVVDEAGRNRRNNYCIYLKLHWGVRDFLLYIIAYEMYEGGTFKKITGLWISNVLFNVIYFEA